ncbi:MAG TPA: extracellular solute-binding protein [Actinomycetota bacterium]|nr:extracellular solute-binding protein [Actinomycetota bacterium]
MRYRSKTFAAMATVFALVAVACGGGGGGGATPKATGSLAGTTITFSVSLATNENAAVQEVLGMFKDQTGVNVKLTAITAADLPQKLQVETDSNHHTVHLFAQDNVSLAILVDKDLVEDLSDVQLPDGVTPALIPDKFDGKQYFLPFRPNVRVSYVNKDRFSAAGVTMPKTVEEYKTVAEKLKTAGGGQGKVTLSLADAPNPDPLGITISEWIVSYGGDPLILNDQGSVQAYTFLQGLWKEGVFAPESKQAKYDTEVNYLKGETAWFATNWTFTTGLLAESGILDKFDVYEGWAGPVRAAHAIGGDVLGIPKGVSGKEKEAAIALAQFLSSKPAQEILSAKNTWLSVRSDALGQVPADQQSTFQAATAELADGWYRPNVVYWNDVELAMTDAVKRIIYGGEDAATVLNEEHQKIADAAQKAGVEYPPAASA